MLYPSINVLRTKADSKYTLVSLAAKRSRDIIDGKPTLVQLDINKPVSIATREIADDLITYSRDFATEEEAESLAEGYGNEESEDNKTDFINVFGELETAVSGDSAEPEDEESADEESYWEAEEPEVSEGDTDEEHHAEY